jgi:putative ABC transport system substrate-binding protein
MHFHRVKRREFLTLVSGAAGAWPLVARAQQAERVRRIGVFMNLPADDPEGQARIAAFLQGLEGLRWTTGRNVQIDYRWAAGDAERFRKYAAEMIALRPDVIVAFGGITVDALQRVSLKVPIVFVTAIDPVGAGRVASLARPGGNTTGFLSLEYGIGAKWLELLKDIAPRVTRVAVIRDRTVGGTGQLGALQAVAPFAKVEVSPIDARDPGEIERAVAAFAREPNGGLIVAAGTSTAIHREPIIALAAHHRLPAVYNQRIFPAGGGLMSYGAVITEIWRRAAGYVDRILKGENPADLPVQAPTKYELVINLKTAKALGLTVPDTLLARADEVIE